MIPFILLFYELTFETGCVAAAWKLEVSMHHDYRNLCSFHDKCDVQTFEEKKNEMKIALLLKLKRKHHSKTDSMLLCSY